MKIRISLKKKCLVVLLIVISHSTQTQNTYHPNTSSSKAIKTYINQLVRRYHFNKQKLTVLLNASQYNPHIIHAITHPFEEEPWDHYRHFFLKKERIQTGSLYWKQHQKVFQTTEKRYGVPPEIITALIAIESHFGQHLGHYNELSTLMTLSFYYHNKRANFFRNELTHFLLLTRDNKLNPMTLKGSYAGALGIPQFMPSSYYRYGISYDNTAPLNLSTNHANAIISIAHYLKAAGWLPEQPIAIPAQITNMIDSKLISLSAQPQHTLQFFQRHHVFPKKTQVLTLKSALIAMKNTHSTEYWLVFKNFHAIMQYNPRTVYALAVFELSRAIKKAYERSFTTKSSSTAPGWPTSASRSALSAITQKPFSKIKHFASTGNALCPIQTIQKSAHFARPSTRHQAALSSTLQQQR